MAKITKSAGAVSRKAGRKNPLRDKSPRGESRTNQSNPKRTKQKSGKALDNSSDRNIEKTIKSVNVFAKARRAMLNLGETILEAQEGAIYRVHADGSREFVKKIAGP